MKTTHYELGGKSYLMCFSARVMKAFTERYGSIENIGDALAKNAVAALDEACFMLATLLDAGNRYARLNTIENPPPLTIDDLLDLCGIEEIAKIQAAITDCIASGSEVGVKILPEKGKNGETTPAN